jgi:quercetin dioxygenase-like cupin family protein
MINTVVAKHSFTYDGTEVAIYHANKNDGIARHTHEHSHATFCTSGSCAIRVEDKELIITKDTQPINLTAGKWHEIEALENNTVFINVFSKGKY